MLTFIPGTAVLPRTLGCGLVCDSKLMRASPQTPVCRAQGSSRIAMLEHGSCGDRLTVPAGLQEQATVDELSVAVPDAVVTTAAADNVDDQNAQASFMYALLGFAVAAFENPGLAFAEDGSNALKDAFTSIPVSLAHPATMWLMFATALYAFYLGWQSRQIRSVDAERRKELVKSKVTQRHFTTASALFTIMTIATFSGMGNTYARTGKLFPGPHLYAGLGLVALMSVMSAMVPYMQQGKDWAKNVHFTLAFGAVSLFAWQAQSGMVIVSKLLHWD